MTGQNILRTVAVAASAALLVTALAVPAMAKPRDCTYDFKRDFPSYDPKGDNVLAVSVGAGEVACGGRGNDIVDDVVKGGKFYGGRGDDRVDGDLATGGFFKGGRGQDSVGHVWSGALFKGGAGGDRVDGYLAGGTFRGGRGDDSVNILLGEPNQRGVVTQFYGGRGSDTVTSYQGGECYSVENCPR